MNVTIELGKTATRPARCHEVFLADPAAIKKYARRLRDTTPRPYVLVKSGEEPLFLAGSDERGRPAERIYTKEFLEEQKKPEAKPVAQS